MTDRTRRGAKVPVTDQRPTTYDTAAMAAAIAGGSPAGLDALVGQRITLFCMNYIYTGKLEALTPDGCALLSSPAIVYETGAFTTKEWQDAQALPNSLYVLLSAVEAIGVVK